MEEKSDKIKKSLGIVGNVLSWVLFALAAALMVFTLVSVTTVGKHDRSLFGMKFFIVLSDSMSDTFNAGDMIVCKEVDNVDELQEGDIITFVSVNPESYNEVITHKIRKKTYDKYGDPCFITYGTTTGVDDSEPVAYNYVLGEYSFKLPKAGTFFEFLKSTFGYITFILVPFAALMIVQAIRCIGAFRKYKEAQNAEIMAQKDAVAAEKEETLRLLEELRMLKEQLGSTPTPTPQTQEPSEPPVTDEPPATDEQSE